MYNQERLRIGAKECSHRNSMSRPRKMRIHPGIRIDKIPVKGPMGLVFTVGVLILFLVGLPAARWFLALSVLVGVIIGIVLRLTSRQ